MTPAEDAAPNGWSEASSTSDSPNGRAVSPPEVTEAEEEAIHDYYDRLAHTNTRSGKRLHPVDPRTNNPLCFDDRGSHGEDNWQRKDASVFPVGYRPVCRFCAEVWRRRTGGLG